MAKPIPDDYPRVTPYLTVDGAGAAIDFYCAVLGARERMRMPGPDGKVGHAELELGDSMIMLADQNPDMDVRGPRAIGGTPVTMHVYVEDADGVFDGRSRAGPRRYARSRISSTAIARASSRIRSATAGTSRPTSRTCHPTRWRGEPLPPCRSAEPPSQSDCGSPPA